jgi:drug/metabolite transporter (DMT)-like permease
MRSAANEAAAAAASAPDAVLEVRQAPPASHRRGIAMLVGALLVLPGMDAIAKYLSARLSTLEITWARFVVFALVLVPFAWRRHGRALLRPARPGLQLLRGLLLALSAWMFFLAVARMPLADTMAVFFVYPMLVLIGSARILRETIGGRQWLLVGAGFVGTVLVTHPSLRGVSAGVPFALASAAAYASGLLVTRRLAAEDPALVTTAISAVFGVALYSVLVPWVWQMPRPRELPWLALMGVVAAIGHFLIARAHHFARASQLAPYGYTEIVAAIILGALVFEDIPGPLVWAGIALIIASGVLAVRAPRVRRTYAAPAIVATAGPPDRPLDRQAG